MHAHQITAATNALLAEKDPWNRPGSSELFQVVLDLFHVISAHDIHEFQSPRFEGQLVQEILGPLAVGTGAFDEYHHLPWLDFAVHKLLSHGDELRGKKP